MCKWDDWKVIINAVHRLKQPFQPQTTHCKRGAEDLYHQSPKHPRKQQAHEKMANTGTVRDASQNPVMSCHHHLSQWSGKPSLKRL